MIEENISQEFRLKNIDETNIFFLKEIEKKELMSKKHQKVCTTLNYIEHFLILHFLNFCFCFFDWHSYRNYEFYNRIKNVVQ